MRRIVSIVTSGSSRRVLPSVTTRLAQLSTRSQKLSAMRVPTWQLAMCGR